MSNGCEGWRFFQRERVSNRNVKIPKISKDFWCGFTKPLVYICWKHLIFPKWIWLNQYGNRLRNDCGYHGNLLIWSVGGCGITKKTSDRTVNTTDHPFPLCFWNVQKENHRDFVCLTFHFTICIWVKQYGWMLSVIFLLIRLIKQCTRAFCEFGKKRRRKMPPLLPSSSSFCYYVLLLHNPLWYSTLGPSPSTTSISISTKTLFRIYQIYRFIYEHPCSSFDLWFSTLWCIDWINRRHEFVPRIPLQLKCKNVTIPHMLCFATLRSVYTESATAIIVISYVIMWAALNCFS